jgi:hypothetical protein
LRKRLWKRENRFSGALFEVNGFEILDERPSVSWPVILTLDRVSAKKPSKPTPHQPAYAGPLAMLIKDTTSKLALLAGIGKLDRF